MHLKLFRETDARVFQIAFLALMLMIGVFLRDFPISFAAAATCVGASWLTQLVAIRFKQLPWSSLLSATISGLGLCLLCRSHSLLLLALAAFCAIGSKFLLKWKNKHFFNPTNFGLVLLFLLTDGVWVSPAQWGEEVVLIFWIALMGITVVHSAWRYDVSAAFLATFVILLVLRVIYLGQPGAVFWHQFNSGSLILFTFFMISDPRSTPDHVKGRLVFGALVAVVAYVLRFHFYHPQGPLLALFFLSPLTICFDSIWKSGRFEWANRLGKWNWSHHEKHLSVPHLKPSL